MRRAAAALVLALVLVGAAGCTSAPDQLVPPTGFRTALEQTATTRADGLVEWRTDWVLHWAEVPAAAGYVARFATSEGPGGRERRLDVPMLRLDVAAGTSRPDRLARDREAQRTLTASQLLVSVAAVGEDDVVGPASPWYRVGETGDGGVPVPNPVPDHG